MSLKCTKGMLNSRKRIWHACLATKNDSSFDMKNWVSTDQTFLFLTTYVIPAATHCSYVLLDCHAQIKIMSTYIYPWFEKCTNFGFSKQLMLYAFIRNQRPNDYIISICTHASCLSFMESVLLYLTCISWNPLDTDLLIHRINANKYLHWHVSPLL